MYTPSELRGDIRAAELAVARIRPGVQPKDVLDLLNLLDRLASGYEALAATGIDLRPELGRIETVHNILKEKDRVAVRMLNRIEGLDKIRAERKPPTENWWWYLERRVSERIAARSRRFVSIGVAVGLLLAVLSFLYVQFLRPDEATRLRYEYVYEAESQLSQGNYDEALLKYQQALAVVPEDPEVNLSIGIVYEALEQSSQAATYYARAESLYGERAIFLTMRGQRYGFLGWYERSEVDVQEAIVLDDQFALAYCMLGNAYEGQGRIRDAVDAVQACADLAREQDQNELYVIASSRLALLLQTPSEPIGEQEDQTSSP